jgi:hypothetical protein
MDAAGSISNQIRNILAQVNNTTVSIGRQEGHYISSAQVAVLSACADKLESLETLPVIDTPSSSIVVPASSEEDVIRAQRAELARIIKRKTIELSSADKSHKPSLNLELGKLYSERARLDKLIKDIDSLL